MKLQTKKLNSDEYSIINTPYAIGRCIDKTWNVYYKGVNLRGYNQKTKGDALLAVQGRMDRVNFN